MLTQDGKVLNPDFKDYKMLNSGNAFPMVVKFLKYRAKTAHLVAKEQEIGIVGVAPSIANAIYDGRCENLRLPITV